MRGDWVRIKLEHICDFIGGGTPSKKEVSYWGGDIPWASIKDIKGQYLVETQDYITDQGLKNSSSNLANPGDIILATRITPGRPIQAKIKTAINQDLKIVRPKILIDPLYLYYSFRSFEKDIVKISSGTTVLGVTLNNLKELIFPVPALPEQREIVAKIEQLLSELDNGIANLKAAQDKLEIYRQAVLKKAFEGELTKQWREQQSDLPTADELLEQIKQERQRHYEQQLFDWENAVVAWEAGGKEEKKPAKPKKLKDYTFDLENTSQLPKDWFYLELGLVIEEPKYGTSKKCSYGFANKGVLRIPNIQNGRIDVSDLKYAEFSSQEISTYKLADGDILLIRSNGSVDIVGKCALIKNQDTEFLFAGYLIRLRSIKNTIEAKYLVWCLSSIDLRTQIESKAKSTSGVNNINSGELSSLVVPICNKEEQTQIVQEIESRLSVCDKLAETIKEQLDKAEALRQSILKKAFEGRLLSDAEIESCKQEADWEPAEQLLLRIKEEKELNNKKAKQKSKPSKNKVKN